MLFRSILNVGNSHSVELSEFIRTIEDVMGRRAEKIYLPMQAGDVTATWADAGDQAKLTHFMPHTPLREGIQKFYDWFSDYYKNSDPSER